MGNIEFAWDSRKERSDREKHGISFEEAKTEFLDEDARLIDDPDHSEREERLLILGYSLEARCLMVSHCYRESDSVIRIISARRAATREKKMYWSFR